MKIPFSQISRARHEYSLADIEINTDSENFYVQGAVALTCTLQKKGTERVLLQGAVRATLLLTCDRCLCEYTRVVDSHLRLICEVNEPDNGKIRNVDLSVRDLDVVQLAEPVVDLQEIARQQLYLCLPQQQICMENCQGLCPECGVDLNRHHCGCRDERRTGPFAGLRELLEK